MNIRLGDIIHDEGDAAVDPYCILHYSETAPLIELEWSANGVSDMAVWRLYSKDRGSILTESEMST